MFLPYLVIALSSIAGGPVDPALERLSPGPHMRCGADSLYVAVSQLGQSPKYDQFLVECGVGPDGTSLKQLGQAAETYGVSHLAVRLDAVPLCEVLQTYPGTLLAICHESRGHFFLAYREREGGIALMDSSLKSVEHDIGPARFRKFSGNCLLLSDAPIPLPTIEKLAAQGVDWSGTGLLWMGGAGLASFVFGLLVAGRRETAVRAPLADPVPAPGPTSVSAHRTIEAGLWLLVTCSLAAGCQRAGGSANNPMPSSPAGLDTVVLLGQNATIDAGRFFYSTDGSQPTLSFTVKNPLPESLAVESVRSSCGCSNAWVDDKLIPAGGESLLHVRMNAGLAGGRQIVLTMEHGKERSTAVAIDGQFFDTCRIEPAQLAFPRAGDEAATRSSVAYVHVTSSSESPPEVVCRSEEGSPVTAGPVVHRATQGIEGETGVFRHVYQVPVTLGPGELAVARSTGQSTVSFLIGESRQPRTLGVSWTRDGGLIAAPRSVVLSRMAPRQKIVIRAVDGRKFRIADAKLPMSAAPIVIAGGSELQESHVIDVSLPPGAMAPSGLTGRADLQITVAGNGLSDLSVPVSWQF